MFTSFLFEPSFEVVSEDRKTVRELGILVCLAGKMRISDDGGLAIEYQEKLRLNALREWAKKGFFALSGEIFIPSVVSFLCHHPHKLSFCVKTIGRFEP